MPGLVDRLIGAVSAHQCGWEKQHESAIRQVLAGAPDAHDLTMLMESHRYSEFQRRCACGLRVSSVAHTRHLAETILASAPESLPLDACGVPTCPHGVHATNTCGACGRFPLSEPKRDQRREMLDDALALITAVREAI